MHLSRRFCQLLPLVWLLPGLLQAAGPPASLHPLPAAAALTATDLSAAPATGEVDPAIVERLRQAHEAAVAAQDNPVQSVQRRGVSRRSLIERRMAEGWSIEWRANGSIRQIKGDRLEGASPRRGSEDGRDRTTARRFLERNRDLLGLVDPTTELVLQSRSVDALGHRRLRFHQRYNALPVWPADLSVHLDPDGDVRLMNGNYIPSPRKPLPTKPLVDADEALELARGAVERGDEAVVATPPELIIYAADGHAPRLAWRIELPVALSLAWQVVVDGLDGSILSVIDQIQRGAVQGSGVDLLGVTRSINLIEEGGVYTMVDTTKQMASSKGQIEIYDFAGQPESGRYKVHQSNSPNSGFVPDGVSLSYLTSSIYDFYRDVYGRDSIDGQGGPIFGFTRMGGENSENAFWNGVFIAFGKDQPFAGSLDVVAHEIQHGVTQYSANLIYQNQSGALNEAFSDIFAELAEAHIEGRNDWKIGSGLATPFRDMSNPKATPVGIPGMEYPADFSEYITMREDNGGVHINMSIINRAFYLLAEGFDNAIGLADAGKIFYRALTTHLGRNSQFTDARLAAISSAEELFGAGSDQAVRVAEAFDAVGVGHQPSTQPSPSRKAVSAGDSTLFICIDPYDGSNYICRREDGFDPDDGVLVSYNPVQATMMSVTANGELAAYVSASYDFCFLVIAAPGNDSCLGMPGSVHAAAMSADGQRYGFVFLNESGEPDNRIMLIDLASETSKVVTLEAPAYDGVTSQTILYADAMQITSDGSTIIFDALNAARSDSGEQVSAWAIYGMDWDSGATGVVVSPALGVDAVFPRLGHTSDNYLLFTISDPVNNTSGIYAANLASNEMRQVATASGSLSAASFTGDDMAMIYDTYDTGTVSGYALHYQALESDHVTPRGDVSRWLANGIFGVIYRRGEVVATDVGGYFDLNTQLLRLEALEIAGGGGAALFRVDMVVYDVSDSIYLAVYDVAMTGSAAGSAVSRYDQSSGVVEVPAIVITDFNGNSQYYNMYLQWVPHPSMMIFKVVGLSAV